MESTKFADLFPKLYHLTFASNMDGIRQHGLHSANSLADLHAFDDDERQASIILRRRCIQTLHGVSLRDQHTANEKRMRSCLVGITIPEWLNLLNSKTFFFLEKKKALNLAQVYAPYRNVLLEIDTAQLLTTHGQHTTLSRINTGAFLFNSPARGRDTFIPLSEFIYRNRRNTPAELTLDAPIPNILSIATVMELEASSA